MSYEMFICYGKTLIFNLVELDRRTTRSLINETFQTVILPIQNYKKRTNHPKSHFL